MHPSYEDRPDAPDRVFARVDDETYEHLVAAWMRAFRDAGAAQADILHLNHLTPLNEAAARIAPHVPVVGHLHGTELLMLEAIAQGPPMGWAHAQAWAVRMRRWASACQRLVVLSKTQIERLTHVLPIHPEHCVVIPNGFDPQLFDRHEVDRRALWQQLLVEHPLGWHPHGEPGTVAYRPDELSPFAEGPVLLYVGRFTAVKRLRLLITAYALARKSFNQPAPLVLVGGFPGEWEEIIDDGQTGWLVPPDDEGALAGALLEAVNDDELRLQRGAAAYIAARARYSWPALGEKLARTYEAVLARPLFPDA